MEVTELFGKVRRLLNLKATKVLKPLGIGPKQAALLHSIYKAEVCSPAFLARETQSDPAAVGRALAPLLKRKWVQRKGHRDDRRQWDIQLTPLGRKHMDELEKVFLKIADSMCEKLSASERQVFRDLLFKISNHLQTRLDSGTN